MKPLLLFTLITFLFTAVTQAGISVIGNLARTTTLKPGDSFEGVILVRNNDKEPADVRLSQSDYLFQSDGSNDYAEAGKTALKCKLDHGNSIAREDRARRNVVGPL
jgi:hypothetical protein